MLLLRAMSGGGQRVVWLSVLCLALVGCTVNATLCDVTQGGQTIIMELMESLGNQVDQIFTPGILPIEGAGSDAVSLELSQESNDYFTLQPDGSLTLNKPLDRDMEDLSAINFQVSCAVPGVDGAVHSHPVIVRVGDLNDNPPVFKGTPYSFQVPESTGIGSTVFSKVHADDADAGVNGQVDYSIIPSQDSTLPDGYEFFNIQLPHQGLITLKRSLDYETAQKYQLVILAMDRASTPELRLSSSTTIMVEVLDEDDQDPTFVYENCETDGKICKQIQYKATVTSGKISGVLDVTPEQIRAIDQDSLAEPVRYSFMSGTPNSFSNYFKIDPETGSVTQIGAVQESSIKQFQITIKAEEQSDARRSSNTELLINVLAVDHSPPIINVNSYSGVVEENAAIGTFVQDDNYPEARPLILTVIDPDLNLLDTVPEYSWELTTTAFQINSDGVLIVAEEGLDRDNLNLGLYTFQVVAREEGIGSKAASAPITLTVELTDINDNAPWLPVSPPVSIQAPGIKGQFLTKITAKDLDDGVNAEITYSFLNPIRDVEEKFLIDSATGEITLKEEVSKGEFYVLNIKATDQGGLYGSTAIDVSVGRGPNKGGPAFTKPNYSTKVSEKVQLKTPILTLETVDPDGDSSLFSLVSGNQLEHFEVGSSSGIVRVIQPLDRETVDSYILTVMAQDPDGVASNTTVAITVTDVNDNTPEFKGLPYSFRVDEGKINIPVGNIQADDADSGARAELIYSIQNATYFSVDNTTGIITTKHELDYEKQQVHYLVVVASDITDEPRQTTATVTVLVSDLKDEYPYFTTTSYQAQVAENIANVTLTTVEAVDPDSQPEISYVLVSGNEKLFHVDPVSGDVSTKLPLDYEAQPVYELIIGTLQNPTKSSNATCTVSVSVSDVNDNPPVFSSTIPSSYISETESPGWIIGTVTAFDRDATEPNSLIRYTLAENAEMNKYFSIDESAGILTLKEMLKDLNESSIEVVIIASDLGEPPFSTNTSLTVSIEREYKEELKNYTSFTSADYSVSVPEDVRIGDIVTKLPLINKPLAEQKLQCAITNGNDNGLFGITGTNDNDCNMIAAKNLDFEDIRQHMITVEIYEPFAPQTTLNRLTKVNISITDVNDNIPQFEYDTKTTGTKSKMYYSVVSQDAAIATSVIKVLANDGDAGLAGKIQYSLRPAQNRGAYFSISPSTGVIRTDKELDYVPEDLQPFNLTVVATDNNGDENSNSNNASVIINLIQPKDRLILVMKAPAEEIRSNKMKIKSILEEHSDHIIEIERIESHTMLKNGSTIDVSHVLFHMIHPETGVLLNYDHPNFNRLASKSSGKDILYQVEATLGKPALEIHHPHSIVQLESIEVEEEDIKVSEAKSIFVWDEIQVPLFVLAGVILVLGLIGIIVVCIQWQRYVNNRDEPSKAMVIVAPPYEPVHSVIEPESKEYEVQVLHMSVPMDDDSMDNVPISTRASHHFSMDNVSYITKQAQSEDESSISEMDDDMMLNNSSRIQDSRHHSNWDSPVPAILPASLSTSTPIGRNPAYERFPGDEDIHDGEGPLSVSTSNDNVMFARRPQVDKFSAQTTTEL